MKLSSIGLVLLIKYGACLAAYTNIPNMINNRIASAMAGQVAAQNLKIVNIQSSVIASLKMGAIVGAIDAIARRVTSNFLQCPTQGYADVMLTTTSSISRAVVSGLLFSYLNYYGFKMNPIIYSLIYAAADTLVTGSINIQMFGTKDQKNNFIQILSENSLWQSIFAMSFSAAGNAIAYLFPSHKYTANFITQMTFIYGSAIAYITYIEVWFAFAELKNLG